MRRLVATVGIVCGLWLMGTGINDFDNARDILGTLKGLFWVLVGAGAFHGFLQDFKQNKWPF